MPIHTYDTVIIHMCLHFPHYATANSHSRKPKKKLWVDRESSLLGSTTSLCNIKLSNGLCVYVLGTTPIVYFIYRVLYGIPTLESTLDDTADISKLNKMCVYIPPRGARKTAR